MADDRKEALLEAKKIREELHNIDLAYCGTDVVENASSNPEVCLKVAMFITSRAIADPLVAPLVFQSAPKGQELE